MTPVCRNCQHFTPSHPMLPTGSMGICGISEKMVTRVVFRPASGGVIAVPTEVTEKDDGVFPEETCEKWKGRLG